MGIKKVFKKRDPTEEELREDLNRIGITTKSTKGREEKFGAFKQYAQERQNAKPTIQPTNPYANLNNNEGPGNGNGNPYGASGAENGGFGRGSAYGGGNTSSPYDKPANPYGGGRSSGPAKDRMLNTGAGSQAQAQAGGRNPYGVSQSQSGTNGQSDSSNPYGASRGGTGGGSSSSFDPYSRNTTRDTLVSSKKPRAYDEETLDLNEIPADQMGVARKPVRRKQAADDLDLNELPDEDDLNVDLGELPQEQEVNSEDETVEAIKQDIRFVKQESVASTRNTLRMAQEADASATNTLGMLGSQSERLYNAEQNLVLADTQSKIADEKIKELNRLNRSIFIPAYGNPFNKKSRLRQQEVKIKNDKSQEKYLRETNRREMYASEQRIKEGIMKNATSSETFQKYQGERDLNAAKRYQFENDSEDDEMEKEIAGNLDEIGLFSKKLQNSAKTMGQEVESQNARLRKIEEDADRLDINVHMNNTKLSNIR